MVKGSIGHAFTVCILTLEIQIKGAFALLLIRFRPQRPEKERPAKAAPPSIKTD